MIIKFNGNLPTVTENNTPVIFAPGTVEDYVVLPNGYMPLMFLCYSYPGQYRERLIGFSPSHKCPIVNLTLSDSGKEFICYAIKTE